MPIAATRRSDLAVIGAQAINSISNFVAVVIVARNVDLKAFALFALTQAGAYLLQLVHQQAFGDQVLRGGRHQVGSYALLARRSLPRMMIPAFILAFIGISMPEQAGTFSAIAVAACAATMLLALDAGRILLIRLGATRQAVTADVVFGGAQLLTLAAAAESLGLTVQGAWACWALAGACGATYAVVALVRALRNVKGSEVNVAYSWTYAAEALWLTGAGQLSLLAVAPFVGATFAAAYRGAQLLFGPIAVLYVATRPIAMPRWADRPAKPPWSLAILPCIGASFCVAIVAVPDRVGEGLLGDTWSEASRLLPLLAFSIIVQGLYTGAFFFRRAQADDDVTRLSKYVQLVIVIAGTVIAAVLGEGVYYVIAIICSMTAASLILVCGFTFKVRPSALERS